MCGTIHMNYVCATVNMRRAMIMCRAIIMRLPTHGFWHTRLVSTHKGRAHTKHQDDKTLLKTTRHYLFGHRAVERCRKKTHSYRV